MSSDLMAFVTARLAELEAADWHVLDCNGMPWPDDRCCDVQRWLVREVAAKRAILAEHAPTDWIVYGDHACTRCRLSDDEAIPDGHHWMLWPCPTVRHLAAVWSNHPDYQPEWKP